MTDWHIRAACRGLDINLFFPEKGDAQTARTALHYCNGGTYRDDNNRPQETLPCPVREQCLNYALSFPPDQDAYGIYGGMNPHQRDKERTTRKNRIVREPATRARIERDNSRIERENHDTGDHARIEHESEPPPAEPTPARWLIDDAWRAGVRELLALIRQAALDDEQQRRESRRQHRAGQNNVMTK